MRPPGGLSPQRLRVLRDVMAGHVERAATPGLVYAVARRGAVHVETLGTTRVDAGAPVRRDTVFRISSMSKPVTAAAALLLVERCQLRLDDPVDAWLPELAHPAVLRAPDAALDDTVAATRPITVRDLLTSTLGTGHVMAPPGSTPLLRTLDGLGLAAGPPQPDAMPGPDEWLRRLGSLPLVHQPGEAWMYHTAMDVLGVLVARVSGRSLGTVLGEELFAPLGMHDTGFSVPPDAIDRFGPCYGSWRTGATEVFDEAQGGQWSRPPAFESGGAGLVSTVDDYLAFASMLLGLGRNQGRRILSRPSVEAMTTDQLTETQRSSAGPILPAGCGWGFGMSVVTRRTGPTLSVGSYGWNGGLGTSWFNDPAETLVGILMTPTAWPSAEPPPLFRDFWTGVYQAIDD